MSAAAACMDGADSEQRGLIVAKYEAICYTRIWYTKRMVNIMTKIKLKKKIDVKETVCMVFLALVLSFFLAAVITGLWTLTFNNNIRYYDLDLDINIDLLEQNDDGYYILNDNEFEHVIDISPNWYDQEETWFSLKYLVRDSRSLEKEADILSIKCLDADMNELTDEVPLKNGVINNVLVPSGCVYVRWYIRAEAGEQISFRLCRVGSREVYNRWGELFGITGIFFVVFCLLIAGAQILLAAYDRKIPWDFPITVMSYLFEKVRWVLTRFRFLRRNGAVSKVVYAIGCIAAFILVYQITFFKSSEAKKCLMMLMMVLCTAGCGYGARMNWRFCEKEPDRAVRRGGIKRSILSISFFWFSVMLCISEIVVQKQFFGAGFMYLIMFGFIGYCMSYSSTSYDFIRYLKAGILINYIYIIIQCVFVIHEIRTWGTAYYYSGINYNPALFGVNVIGPFIILVSDLDEQLEKGKITVRFILTAFLLGTAIFFLWSAQARTMFFLEILVGLVFFGKLFVMRKSYPNKLMLLGQLLIAGVLVVVSWNMTLWGINNFALKDTEYVLKVSALTGMEVYADDGSRIFSTFTSGLSLQRFTSGRLGMWITYFKNMNLFGHDDLGFCPTFQGWITPHNSVLWYMYEYGALTVAPYLIMMVSFCVEAFRYAKRWCFKNKNAMLPFYTFCMIFVLGLTETVEDVFRWYTPWLLVYIVVLFLMGNHDTVKAQERPENYRKKSIIQGILVASAMLVFLKYTL